MNTENDENVTVDYTHMLPFQAFRLIQIQMVLSWIPTQNQIYMILHHHLSKVLKFSIWIALMKKVKTCHQTTDESHENTCTIPTPLTGKIHEQSINEDKQN